MKIGSGFFIRWAAPLAVGVAALIWALEAPRSGAEEATVVIGHFPNLTHVQGVIGHARGDFDRALAGEAVIDWKVFNAGPSAIEALFAGKLDITYIGPSPAVNAYVKSGGDAVRVVAGAASGGAALVVRSDSGIEKPEDFRGKKIASPQLGNTQDVALRSWLGANGLKLKETGGDVRVLPLANADQVTLLLKKEIDAAWTVEPWVSILTTSAGARVFLEESSLWPDGRYSTALVLVRREFLEKHPAIVKQFLAEHVRLTEWARSNPDEAKRVAREAIEAWTHKELPQAIVDSAWARLRFDTDPLEASVLEQARAAHRAGYLKKEPDLSGLFEPGPLKEVLAQKPVE